VTHDDLLILATRAAEKDVPDAIMVAMASGQPDLRLHEAQAWAAQKGVALTVFQDWSTLTWQVLHYRTPQAVSSRDLHRGLVAPGGLDATPPDSSQATSDRRSSTASGVPMAMLRRAM
jgi:hypothetical protein